MAHPFIMGRNKAQARAAGAPTTGGNRVTWTGEEKLLIARTSLFAMAENTSLSRVDALRIGVAALPPTRRKPVVDWAHSQWVVPYWEQIATEHDAATLKKKSVEAITQSPRAKAEALFASTPPVPVPPPPEPRPQPTAELFAANDTSPPPDSNNAAASAPETPAVEQIIVPSTADKPKARRGAVKGQPMIRWSDRERRMVAKAYVKAKQDFPDMSDTEALRKAMRDMLPDDRQRKINGYGMERPWLDPLIPEVESEVTLERELKARERADRDAQEQAQIHAEQTREQRARETEEQRARELDIVREQAVIEFQANAPLEDLISAVARRLVSALVTPVLENLNDALREAKHTMNPAAARYDLGHVSPPPRAHKPKVYVVGLLREQHQNLSKAFPTLEFNFGGNLDQGGISSDKVSHADLVLLMTDYISHTVRSQVKRAAPNLVPLTGSYSSAKRCVLQWIGAEASRMST